MVFFSELVSALVIAVVQGITEWVPVSSSGHLVLAERILGYAGGLEFDVALHFGTLMAVFVYFGKQITDIIEDILKGRWKSDNARLGFLLLLGAAPAGLIGLFFRGTFISVFGSLGVVAISFAITGTILLIASFDFGRKGKIGWKEALIIGFIQVFALFPGISRSGATIAAGLLLGLKERDAMKFSFLLAIPLIFGASVLTVGNQALESSLIWATLVSFVVGLGAIHILYKYVLARKKNLRWFGVYCLLLAFGLGGILILS